MNGKTLQIAFVGPSGSGKTTLIERLIGPLQAAGLAVGVVKHTHHQIELDAVGKDSWRFREAGAARVVLVTHERLLTQSPLEPLETSPLLQGCDLVIHEGDRHSTLPKVLVGEDEVGAGERGTIGDYVAVVGKPAGDLPAYHRADVAGIAAFLLRWLQETSQASSLEALLAEAASVHGHICPGQVLGVRMAIKGLQELGLPVPPPRKRLVVFVENDLCAADAVGSVTGCSLGKRTLKFLDFGKMAACFLDEQTGQAVRVVGRDSAREKAPLYAGGEIDREAMQLAAYRVMPDEELLSVQPVQIDLDRFERPGARRTRVACQDCGEEVAAHRAVTGPSGALCRACAEGGYYTSAVPPVAVAGTREPNGPLS